MTIKSNTPAHDKDCWQTPLWLFDALDIEFGFWLDSAASDKNALCAHWLTEADDALNSEWISHGAIWNNPPYSNIRPWVEKAAVNRPGFPGEYFICELRLPDHYFRW
ncbi:phage N-6-adenine-methyltransferase, partial [Escherichia coli]|uniref:phage N-6-adenine-methyltransferase n=1 Tax=Escherichia coli TaxID=562 RepID=UPI00201CB823